MDLSIIIVHYRVETLLVRCMRSITKELDRIGIEAEVIVVDNSPSALKTKPADGLNVRYVHTGRNLGYSGGINHGAACAKGRYLIFMNPDVEIMPGSISALLAELKSGAAATGPQFYLDSAHTFLLPPTERRNRFSEALKRVSGRGRYWSSLARRQWRRHARKFWIAKQPFQTPYLSGALLAVTRSAWRRVGPFDEGFKLYFEENDWLFRLKSAGLKSIFVPAASVRHHFNKSAVMQPKAARWFKNSQQRFNERYYGRMFNRLLESIPVGDTNYTSPKAQSLSNSYQIILPREDHKIRYPLWIELAFHGIGFPAAAVRIADCNQKSWQFPTDVRVNLGSGRFQLTVIDDHGYECACYLYPNVQG